MRDIPPVPDGLLVDKTIRSMARPAIYNNLPADKKVTNKGKIPDQGTCSPNCITGYTAIPPNDMKCKVAGGAKFYHAVTGAFAVRRTHILQIRCQMVDHVFMEQLHRIEFTMNLPRMQPGDLVFAFCVF